MRFLVYLLTLLFVGTAVAQNPTILQGNYITNVFGNSNFVLNPNAQTNVLNVTATNATVTRSTTTPLVATTEFNITTSTSTGYADWSTRTFDAGMKGQNCEARFTYRGFSVGTTKAQLIQNSLVVAELTLTASTDPRIASINFPCGDLTYGTSFRLQQSSASLTGTNEIGGIYTGLATNMANVAQAELIGTIKFGTDCTWSSTSSTFTTPSDASCTTTATGNLTAVSGVKPAVIINDTRPGNYYAVWSGGSAQAATSATYNYCSFRLYDGTTEQTGGYIEPTSTVAWTNIYHTSAMFTYTSTGTRQIDVQLKSNNNTASCILNTATNPIQASVYRFPSSSELVVTPERQNVFAGVKYAGSADFTGTSTTYQTVQNSNFGTATLLGKAEAPSAACGLSATDYGFCVKNVPAGTYAVNNNNSAGLIPVNNADSCVFRIIASDGTTTQTAGESFARVNTGANGNYFSVGNGVIKLNSFTPNLAIKFEYRLNSATGTCIVRSNPQSSNNSTQEPSIILTPLDQPSNSALYVQGPVLGAQTGAAIGSGYVGELKEININTSTNVPNDSVYGDIGSFSLTPGIWLIAGNMRVDYDNDVTTSDYCQTGISTSSGNAFADLDGVRNMSILPRLLGRTSDNSALGSVALPNVYLKVTSTTTYYAKVRCGWSGTRPTYQSYYSAIRLN